MFSSTDRLAPTVARPTEAKPAAQDDHPLDSVTATEILNLSAAGKLVAVSVLVKAAPGGTPTAVLKINIDGTGDEIVLPLYTAAAAWGDEAKALAHVGDGDAIDDRIILWLHIDFAASCVVTLDTTSGGSSGTLSGVVLHSEEV